MLKPLAVLSCLAALPAAAEEASPLQLADLSARLYATGVAQSDPVLIATAAKLRKQSGLAPEAAFSWQAMMDVALVLIGDDPGLLTLMADVSAESDKGVASGPEYRLAALAAGTEDRLPPMTFRGGEYAEVYVEAALGVDMNLSVLDAAGHEVCTDTDPSHVAYCAWTPAQDGSFTVVVLNAGATPADYALMTN
jgi:hypothetical protein